MSVDIQATALGVVLAVIGVGTATGWLTVAGVVLVSGVLVHNVLQNL